MLIDQSTTVYKQTPGTPTYAAIPPKSFRGRSSKTKGRVKKMWMHKIP